MRLIITIAFIHFLWSGNICGQNTKLIDELNEELFVRDVSPEGYDYGYYCYNSKDSVYIHSRIEANYTKYKQDRVNAICYKIRLTKNVRLIPHLIEILEKQEQIFLNEWAPVHDCGAPQGLWSDQYSVLCILDLTISYLTIIKEQWSSARTYDFVKNLYMLSYGDYNKTRIAKTIYKSDYVRRVGYCQCGMVRTQNYDRNLIDEFYRRDPKLTDELIKDITLADDRNVNDDEGKYFASGLRNQFYKNKDPRIDSIIVHRPDLLVHIGFKDAVDHWAVDLPIKYYHLNTSRFLNATKNAALIDVLLDDIFQSTEILLKSKRNIGLLRRYKDHLINHMVVNRFLDKLKESKKQEFRSVLLFCNDILSKADKTYLHYQAKRKLSSRKAKAIGKVFSSKKSD